MVEGALHGGSAARRGYYLARATWELVPVERDGDVLPGGAAEPYVRVPLFVVFFLLPVLVLAGGRVDKRPAPRGGRGGGEGPPPP